MTVGLQSLHKDHVFNPQRFDSILTGKGERKWQFEEPGQFFHRSFGTERPEMGGTDLPLPGAEPASQTPLALGILLPRARSVLCP